ncbi:MAG: glycosyltransferase [Myxococcota bacterium]
MFFYWAWLLLACWFGAVCVAWWVSTLRARVWANRVAAQPVDDKCPLLMLRPCAGAEPGLLGRLISSAEVTTERLVRIRFAVANALDPAYPVAAAASVELRSRGWDADVVLTGGGGPNRKVAQLAAAVRSAGGNEPSLMVVDSDVDLEGFDLDRMVDLLQSDPGLGALWSPPHDDGPIETFGDRASHATLNGSFHCFPLLCGIDPTALVGKTFAIQRRALEAIGGFDALIEYLGEDVEISRRLRTAGYRVEPAPVVARSMARGRSFQDVVSRIARWTTVIRAQRPLMMFTYPVFMFAGNLLVIGGTLVGTFGAGWPVGASASLALCVILTRVGLAVTARFRCGLPFSVLTAVIDSIVADVVLMLAFLRACGSRSFEWRGVPLAIDREGRLVAR